MIKPKKLNKGDKIAIVSLSSGALGENFVEHELTLGIKRLKEYGLEVVIMPNSLKGIKYLNDHPEKRAEDLKNAFLDKSIKGIMSAIGGNDTYRLIPYLMEDKEFKEIVRNNPKIFIGFSDTTINHIMLNRIGLSTYYGLSFLADIAELDTNMLPYTKKHFKMLFENPSNYLIESSPVWYMERESYGKEELNVPRISCEEKHGYEVLNGNGIVSGKLYGGCIDSLYKAMTDETKKEIIEKYNIFPSVEEWKEKILFIETSEEMMTPEVLKNALLELDKRNILNLVKGIIVGKPMNEKYYEEYKTVYKEIFKDKSTIVMYNFNFGHSMPRCIIPYDAFATIDTTNKTLTINSNLFLNE